MTTKKKEQKTEGLTEKFKSTSEEARSSLEEVQKILNEDRRVREELVALMSKKDFLDRVKMVRWASETDPAGVDLTSRSGYLLGALFSTVWNRVRNERTRIYKDIVELRKFYLTNTIISQFATDALTPEVGTEEILEVVSTDSDNDLLKDELKELQDKFDLDAIVNSVVEDFLAYGEYYLSVEVDGTVNSPGEGLVDLRDDVEPNSIVCLSEFGNVLGYLHIKRGTGGTERLEFVDKVSYIQFSFQPARLRVDLMKEMEPHIKRIRELEKKYGIKVPRFVRVGKPVIFDVIDKITELSLLEQMVPAISLSAMAAGNVMGVRVSDGMGLEEAMKLARALEELVNKKVSVDTTNKAVSLENIMSSAGRIRFIPIWGTAGGSPVVSLGYKEDVQGLSDWASKIREVICGAAGIPSEVLFHTGMGSSERGARAGILRRYARYLRKLKLIQTAVAKAIEQMAGIHLVARGIPFKPSDIRTRFKNNLIEIDNLDELEYIDTTISVLKNVIEFLMEKMSKYIDEEELIDFVREELSVAGVPSDIFIKTVKQVILPEPNKTPSPSTTIKLVG